jgi:hypothetical protein
MPTIRVNIAIPSKSFSVVGHLLVEVKVVEHRLRIHHERIAVGGLFAAIAPPIIAGGAGPVVDQELLVHLLRHLLKI